MTDQVLQQLISLSQAMLDKARQEEWDEVVVLEAERGGLINSFFSEPIQQEDAEAVGIAIQAIIAIDRDTMALGDLAKSALAQTLHTFSQGKKAVKAYSF